MGSVRFLPILFSINLPILILSHVVRPFSRTLASGTISETRTYHVFLTQQAVKNEVIYYASAFNLIVNEIITDREKQLFLLL